MSTTAKKSIFVFAMALVLAANGLAQSAATVRELVPASAPIGARVMVTGRGLADPAIAVTFASGANAAVIARSDRYVEVVVPANAASGNVRVTSGSTLLNELPFTLTDLPKYTVTTLAGGPRSQNNPFKHPWGAAVILPGGNIAVADEQHNEVKLVTPSGAVSVLAGGFKSPRGITFDASRNVLFVSDTQNNAIRRVALDGTVSTIVASKDLKDPYGLTVGADGAIYVCDSMHDRIARITPEGVVSTFATGFKEPRGIVAAGDVFYVADMKNNAIKKIANGAVSTILAFPADNGNGNDDGADGNPHVLHHPTGIGMDEAGNLIVSDALNDFIRRIDLRTSPATMTVIAGSGKHGWADGDPAAAMFKDPTGLAVAGAIYVGDEDNDALRRLCPEVRITGLNVPVGRLVAGTEVRIFGTGFIPGATTVTFDGVAAADMTWITSTTMTVKLPQAITGGTVAVAVSSCGGSTAPVSFVVDNTPPVLTITNDGAPLPDASMYKVAVVPVLTATDDFDPNPTITATLNGNPFTSGTPVTQDGVYTLVAVAEDSAGNRASATVHFTVDATPPVVNVFEGANPFPAGFIFNRAVVIDVTVADLTETTRDVRIDGNPYVLKQPYAVESAHQLTAKAVDALGNETTVGPLAFTIDLTPPHLTFTSHTQGQVVTDASVIVSGGSDDAVTVSVNGTPATLDTTAKTFASATLTLAEGENTITASGTDAAGNNGTATLSLVLDTRAPELTVASVPSCTNAQSLDLHGTVADPHIDRITLTLGTATVQAALANGSWSATLPLGDEGAKSISIEAADTAGHTAVRQLALSVDRTNPAIEISESGAPFTATLINRAVTLFVRATDADAEASVTATLDGNAFTSGNSVASEGAHTIRVTAKDCAGNESTKTHTFAIDLTPPRFLSFDPANNSKRTDVPATLRGTTDADAVEVRVKGTAVPVANGAFAVPNIGFADGINAFPLEATDAAGNTGRANYSLAIRTDDPLVDITEGGESLVDGTVFTRVVEPRVRVFEDNVTFTATLDGAAFTNGAQVSQDGVHTMTATATDNAFGRSRTITRTFTIDRSGPVVKIVSPANGTRTSDAQVDVRATASDATSVSINGMAAAKQASGEWLVTGLQLDSGDNQLVAVGRDSAGNTASDAVEVTRILPGPAIVLTFPPDPYLTNRPHVDVTGRVLRPSSSVAVTVPPAQAASVATDPAGNFRLAGAELQEGESRITATATENGQSTSVSVKVIADFTPPRVRLLESGEAFADGARFATQAVLTGEATDQGQPVDYVLRVDGAEVASPLTVTAGGGHTAVITARDAAGNEARLERTFYIGSEGGAGCRLEGFDPADGTTVTANKVELVGRSGGAAGVKVNGIAAKMSSGSFCATVELPQEGANTVSIVCTDAQGNPTGDPETITLIRITNDPSVTITTPAEGFVTHDATLTVTGTLGNGAVSVDLNGKPATINGSNWTVTDVRLTDGLNVLVARAKNAAGRSATASRRVTYLEDAPSITITSPIPGFVTGQPKTDVTGTYFNVDPGSLAIAGLAGAIEATPWSDTTGKFVAHEVPLASGDNTITVTGRSRTGRTASAAVTVKYLTTVPVITITDPEDNQYFPASAGESFQVSGVFSGVEGSTVDVNGVAASVDQTNKTFTASVPFNIANTLTPVVARLSQPNGDAGGFDSIRVYKLSAAPKVLETFPAANAVEVDPGVVVLVLFSAPMDGTSTKDAFRLETSNGTPVSGTLYLDKDVLTFAPAATLTPGERYTIKVATSAKDLAGQNLEAAAESSFVAATTAPSTAPTLTTASGRICAQFIDVAGNAAPGARVRIDYGTIFFTTTASATGAFTYKVPLSGQQGFQVIRVRTMGADGSLSPFVELELNVDCTGPQVISASYDRTVNKLTILFSRDINASTLAGNLQLVESTRTLGGATSVSGATVYLTPEEDLTQKTFTLKVLTGVEDTSGRKLELPYTQLFAIGDDEPQPGNGGGYITGEAYDATTGRPLAGADITIEVPVSAFGRAAKVTANAAQTQAVTMTTDARGRYGDLFPEGAYTIKASANGYTSVWRQIIVPAGAGVIPIDIRLTRRGAPQTAGTGAMSLTHGGTNAVARKAELTIAAGAVTSGTDITLTSTGAQSLAGLLPLGWSPLASAEVVASSNIGGRLTFDVPQSQITAAAQTLTAVRYDESRDEWRVLDPVVNIANDKAGFDITSAGAYALVYPDKRPGLATPPQPHAGAPLQGVADPCATGTCPAMLATSFPLDPPVVLPTGSTVATLNIDGADAHVFPSGTAVQAYIDEELRLADGGRELDPPFATDLLLYRTLAGDAAVANFNLAPSPHAAEVFLEVGFENIRILPYPGRLDRGTLVGPEGGRVPGDDQVSVEIPTGATPEALRATASSIADLSTFGTIPGFTILGGLQLTLQRATQPPATDVDGDGDVDPIAGVELTRPARATFTVTTNAAQLILVEVLDTTPFGNRIYRLAAEMTALDGGRWTTKTIDRDALPVDGLIREGRYLLLAADAPIAFATGIVKTGDIATGNARVTTPSLGVADLSRTSGIFNIPVPAAPASPFSLTPRTVALGDGVMYIHPSAPAAGAYVNVGDLVITAQPPVVASTIPAANATSVAMSTSVEATFTPGIDPASIDASSVLVVDTTNNSIVSGTVAAVGNLGVRWTLPAGGALRPSTRYTVTIAPSIRGANGTPLGRAYTFSFTTAEVLTNAEMHAERISITIPDANGVSKITGTAGALKTGWLAVPVRRGSDFFTKYSATAANDGSFSLTIGNTPRDQVAITDDIDLRVLNNNGALVAIIPMTPFVSEDGRAFVAPASQTVTFTSADGIAVTVPAGAFAKNTRIDVIPTTAAAFAEVPRVTDEFNLVAAVTLQFEGRASKPLELVLPASSANFSRPHFLGQLGMSSRGPRIMAVDLLYPTGAGSFTTKRPTTGSNVRTIRVGTNASGYQGNDPKDMLQLVIEAGQYVAMDMKDIGNSNGMVWALMNTGNTVNELFWDTLYSMYVGYRYIVEGRGRVAFPVPAGTKFTVTGVDPATGLITFEQPYSELPVGVPGEGVPIGTPTSDLNGPHPVFGTPFRIENVEAPPAGISIEATRDIELSLDGNGNLTISGANGGTQVSALHVASGELHGPMVLPTTFSNVKAGDAFVLMIDEKEIDPASSVTVVFNEPIDLGAASTQQEVSDYLKTVMHLEQLPTGGNPVDVLTAALLRTDSGDRRVTILLPAPLARDADFRLRLDAGIKDRSGNGLTLGQAGELNSGGTLTPHGGGEMVLRFSTRKPAGVLSSFTLRQRDGAEFGQIRETDKYDNLLFVTALDGGILAYDLSNPAMLDDSLSPKPKPIGMAPGRDSDAYTPITNYWSTEVDEHGRVISVGTTNMFGALRTFRVENFINAQADPNDCLDTIDYTVCKQSGGAIVSQMPGSSYSVGIASAAVATDRVEAIPRKVRVVSANDPVEERTGEELINMYASGASDDVGNGLRRFDPKILASTAKYRLQRITIENLTLGLRWSADAKANSTAPIIPPAEFKNVIARKTDKMRITRNRSTYAVITLFGYGIGVFDVNAVESNELTQWSGASEKPLEQVALRTNASGAAASSDPAIIGDLSYSPESDMFGLEDNSLRIETLDSRKGLVEFSFAPPSQLGHTGDLVFTNGHPRFEALKTAVLSVSPSAFARFNSIAHYRNPDTKKDYVLMPALKFGLLVVEVGATGLTQDSFADVIWSPGGAYAVRVVEGMNLAVVVDEKGYAQLVDLSRVDERVVNGTPTSGLFPTAAAAIAANKPDPRILWISDYPVSFGSGFIPPIVDPDTGMMYSADLLGRNMKVTSAIDPKVRVVADLGRTDGELKEVGTVVPLGIDPPAGVLKCSPDDPSTPDCRASLAAFRLEARLPGSMTESLADIPMVIESERVLGTDMAQMPEPYPVAHLRHMKRDGSAVDDRPTTDFTMKRALDVPAVPELRYQRGWNRFYSDWVVAIADPRASKEYSWPSGADKEEAGCHACDRPPYLSGSGAPSFKEIYSAGRFFLVRPGLNTAGAYGFMAQSHRMETRITTYPGDLVRPSDGATDVDDVAAKNLPDAGSTSESVVAVTTGEITTGGTDLAIRGRGIDFVLQRYYSSAITHVGPFGRNFDSPLFARVEPLPNGDVAYFDGTGRRDVFTGGTTPPEGVFLSMRRDEAGNVVVMYPDNTRMHFDGSGRLTRITDRNTTKTDGSDGNEMRFSYDARGRLKAVTDPTGRAVELTYYATGIRQDCVETVKDFDGRVVKYSYDANGRLEKVEGPDPASASSAAPSTTYTWGPAATTTAKTPLYQSGQITSEKDGLSRTIWNATYNGSYPFAAQTLTTGGGTWTFNLNASDTTVIDPNTHTNVYNRDADGRVTSVVEPGGATTSFTYDEGRLKSITRPMGDSTVYDFGAAGPNGDKRSMGKITTIKQTPRTGTPEAITGMTRITSITYGTANQATSIVNSYGSSTSIVLDARGNPKTVTDAAGVTTTFVYDERGRIKTASDPRTGSETYDYYTDGKAGYVSQLTTPAGTTIFTVDDRGNVTQIVDGAARTTTYGVNKLDQVESETQGDAQTKLTFDAAGEVKAKDIVAGVDASGNPVYRHMTMTVDEVGRLRQRTDDTQTMTLGYDGAGNLKTVTRSGKPGATFGYDDRNRLTTESVGSLSTTYKYDADGALVAVTNSRGKTTSTTVSAFGESVGDITPTGVTTISATDAAGRPVDTKVLKVAGNKTYVLRWSKTEYDGLGRVRRDVRKLFTDPLELPNDGSDPVGATDIVQQTIYDDAARTVTTIDPRGNRTVSVNDELGRLVKVTDAAGNVIEYQYDPNGNKISSTLTEVDGGGSTEKTETRYEYDRENRLVSQIDLTNPQAPLETRYSYDRQGNLSSITDPEGRTTSFEYDRRRRMTLQRAPEGGETTYAYDDNDRVKSITDANGNQTKFTYDANGNLETEQRQDGATWRYTYDANFNKKTATDANGTVVTFEYDDNDRLIQQRIARASAVAGSSQIDYTIDDLGRIAAATTDENVSDTFTYDSLDRELSESVRIGTGPTRTVTRTYDPSGNTVGLVYPSGLQIGMSIDPLDRVKAIRDVANADVPIATYTDIGSRLAVKAIASGVTDRWSYDANRRLSGIASSTLSATLRDVQYERSRSGQKVAVKRPSLGKQSVYGYNRNHWMVSEAHDVPLVGDNPRPAFSRDYDYDDLLNARSVVRTVNAVSGTTTSTTTFGLNDRNQYTSANAEQLVYDANGNLTRRQGVQMQYDFMNRLTDVDLGGGRSLHNVYDAMGRKVRQQITSAGVLQQTTDYVLSGNQVKEEYVNGVLAQRYVHGRDLDEIVRADSGSATVYPLQSETGDVEALVDSDGQLLERYEYDGYGSFRVFDASGALQPASAFGWKWLFQGRERNPIIDAYDFRARTLWPDLGRFAQEDPAAAHRDVSAYQAFLGSPVNLTDPTGNYEEDTHHYLTIFLARAVGWDWLTSNRIGYETGFLDYDDRDAMYGGRNKPSWEKWHFASPARLNQMRREIYATSTMDVRQVGEFLHSTEDSYSHQSNPHYREFGARFLLQSEIGHGAKGHDPDLTWKRPGLAMLMAMDIFVQLRDMCNHFGGCADREPFEGRVRTKIAAFIQYEPEMFDDIVYGKTVPTVRDYTLKIKLLNRSWEIADYERQPREAAYKRYLDRMATKRQLEQERAKLMREPKF